MPHTSEAPNATGADPSIALVSAINSCSKSLDPNLRELRGYLVLGEEPNVSEDFLAFVLVLLHAADFVSGGNRNGATCAGGEDPHVPPQPPAESLPFCNLPTHARSPISAKIPSHLKNDDFKLLPLCRYFVSLIPWSLNAFRISSFGE